MQSILSYFAPDPGETLAPYMNALKKGDADEIRENLSKDLILRIINDENGEKEVYVEPELCIKRLFSTPAHINFSWIQQVAKRTITCNFSQYSKPNKKFVDITCGKITWTWSKKGPLKKIEIVQTHYTEELQNGLT